MLERVGDLVWSPYQMRNILAYVQKCETLRENARQKANAKQMLSKCSPDAQQMLSRSSISTTTETETEIEIDPNTTPKGESEGETKTPKPKTPKLPDTRQAYGPGGWFLSEPDQYEAKVKEFGQAWVDYWVEAFCDWAQSKKPAVSRSRKNHWLSIKCWERSRLEKGKQWCAEHHQGPGYYTAYEIEAEAKRMFGGYHAN
jgi:hypothetical protein